MYLALKNLTAAGGFVVLHMNKWLDVDKMNSNTWRQDIKTHKNVDQCTPTSRKQIANEEIKYKTERP